MDEPRPPLTYVVAMADDGAIGFEGRVPWDIPEDRRHFARLTAGHAIVMGRRTWEEVGAPLAGRRNIVVSRTLGSERGSRGLVLEGAEVVATVEEAITLARTTDPSPRVIGGAAIFDAAFPHVTTIELTEVHRSVRADTYWRFDRSLFTETSRVRGVDPTIEMVTLVRRVG